MNLRTWGEKISVRHTKPTGWSTKIGLPRQRHSQNGSNPLTINHLSGRTACPLEPPFKVPHLYVMIDPNTCDRDSNAGPLRNSRDPVMLSKGGERLGNSFVDRCRGDIDAVRHPFDISDGDAAGSDLHLGNVSYSLYIRHRPQGL